MPVRAESASKIQIRNRSDASQQRSKPKLPLHGYWHDNLVDEKKATARPRSVQVSKRLAVKVTDQTV